MTAAQILRPLLVKNFLDRLVSTPTRLSGTSLAGDVLTTPGQVIASSPINIGKEPGGGEESPEVLFSKEVTTAEAYSKDLAEKEALANLPLPDAAVYGEYPVETIIKKLCLQMFLDWERRVRLSVQERVQHWTMAAHAALLRGQSDLYNLNKARHDIGDLKRRKSAEENGEKATPAEHVVEYRSLLKRAHYRIFLSILVAVDWITNVPVFKQLLPQDPGADQRWLEISSHAEKYGLLSGWYTLFARFCFSPEVCVLAFGVVVFLTVMGHFIGRSFRRIVALPSEPELAGRTTFAAHRKEARFPLATGIVGSLLIVTFLFLSRSKVEIAAHTRVTAAQTNLAALDQKLAEVRRAGDIGQIEAVSQDLEDQRGIIALRMTDAEYALAVSSLNVPILFLNLVLILAAAAAAYLESKDRIVHQVRVRPKAYDPGPALHLAGEVRRLRADLTARSRDIQESITRVRQLCSSTPLKEWRAKAERLDGLVPLFRTENARRRALHVSSIVAFQSPNFIEWPQVDGGWSCEIPDTLVDCETQLRTLQSQIAESDDEETSI